MVPFEPPQVPVEPGTMLRGALQLNDRHSETPQERQGIHALQHLPQTSLQPRRKLIRIGIPSPPMGRCCRHGRAQC
jgi:hypothetical protein